MTDSHQDDARLRATEAQMRHALGLHGEAPQRSVSGQQTTPSNGLHPQRRRFVRDGEVAVTVVQRAHVQDDAGGTNMLETARQALRSAVTARERVERLLEEAQGTIRDLQTKLAHERLAKDEVLEAARRQDNERQTVRQALQTAEAELEAERVARRSAETAMAEAHEGRRDAEQLLRDMQVVEQRAPAAPETPVVRNTGNTHKKLKQAAKPVRRRQPAETVEDDSPVEWWVKGWQEKFR
jgi:hypothetical protein